MLAEGVRKAPILQVFYRKWQTVRAEESRRRKAQLRSNCGQNQGRNLSNESIKYPYAEGGEETGI